jgi:ADP-ribose pyrophosphatase YjhB (NUDIX family)
MADHPHVPDNFSRRVPDGDNRPRLVCDSCGFVSYENPKVVVGSVCIAGDRILLCRRAIMPRLGYWTLPAGYLETHETTADGAMREAMEEACARIEIDALLAVYNVARISQVQVIYRARLLSDVAAGPHCSSCSRFQRYSKLVLDKPSRSTTDWAV